MASMLAETCRTGAIARQSPLPVQAAWLRSRSKSTLRKKWASSGMHRTPTQARRYSEDLMAPKDFLDQPTMLMSKNCMAMSWSWNHCLNAMGLAEKDPELAWQQYMVLFANK